MFPHGFSLESINLNFYVKMTNFYLLASNANFKNHADHMNTCAIQIRPVGSSFTTPALNLQNEGILGDNIES